MSELAELRERYRAALKAEYLAHPEQHGKLFAPRAGRQTEVTIPMSFSATLLDVAGGYEVLMENWEVFQW